jgi:hypothetical protein
MHTERSPLNQMELNSYYCRFEKVSWHELIPQGAGDIMNMLSELMSAKISDRPSHGLKAMQTTGSNKKVSNKKGGQIRCPPFIITVSDKNIEFI